MKLLDYQNAAAFLRVRKKSEIVWPANNIVAVLNMVSICNIC